MSICVIVWTKKESSSFWRWNLTFDVEGLGREEELKPLAKGWSFPFWLELFDFDGAIINKKKGSLILASSNYPIFGLGGLRTPYLTKIIFSCNSIPETKCKKVFKYEGASSFVKRNLASMTWSLFHFQNNCVNKKYKKEEIWIIRLTDEAIIFLFNEIVNSVLIFYFKTYGFIWFERRKVSGLVYVRRSWYVRDKVCIKFDWN